MGEQSLGRMIRRRRESLGFSQARLGELVGRSASTIRNWERGKSTPAAPTDAVALAAILGLDEQEVVAAAGFEKGDVETHQTMEQAYASLSPQAEARFNHERDEKLAERPVPAQGARVDDAPAPPKPEPGDRAGSQAPPETEAAEAAPRSTDPPDELGPVFPPPASDPPVGRRLAALPADRTPDEEKEREGGVGRAAPPTVLEAAPPEEPSYLEDPDERQRYRARAMATAAMVVFLLIVFLWSFDRAVDALGTMWDDFTGMLEL